MIGISEAQDRLLYVWFPTVAADEVVNVKVALERDLGGAAIDDAVFYESVTVEISDRPRTLSVGHRVADDLVDGPASAEVFVFAVLVGSEQIVVWTIELPQERRKCSLHLPTSALLSSQSFDESASHFAVVPVSALQDRWWKRVLNSILPARKRSVEHEIFEGRSDSGR